jgi:hypothetical protein
MYCIHFLIRISGLAYLLKLEIVRSELLDPNLDPTFEIFQQNSTATTNMLD